jgi:hypothetical protein
MGQERRDTSMTHTRTAERQLRNTLFSVEVGSKRLGVKEWE